MLFWVPHDMYCWLSASIIPQVLFGKKVKEWKMWWICQQSAFQGNLQLPNCFFSAPPHPDIAKSLVATLTRTQTHPHTQASCSDTFCWTAPKTRNGGKKSTVGWSRKFRCQTHDSEDTAMGWNTNTHTHTKHTIRVSHRESWHKGMMVIFHHVRPFKTPHYPTYQNNFWIDFSNARKRGDATQGISASVRTELNRERLWGPSELCTS